MLNRHNRLLVTFHVVSDALLAMTAFIIAYALRFHSVVVPLLIPITKGVPPLWQYIQDLPFIAVLVPFGFQLQGLYRLRRGRSRVDDFFAVFVGSILAVLFGIVATLYVTVYFASPAARARGQFEVSQPVWAIFLVLNVALTYASRELVREVLERRWRAGIGLKRILIAGSGELGRLVADKILEHRELGYQIVGFVDDKAAGDHLGYRGLPLLGTMEEAADISAREGIHHLYVALPPEQHLQMIALLDSTSRELVDVKVVPDLLQVIALRARLWDLDGVPVIDVNDVPLQGFNSIVKRAIDIALSSAALLVLALPLGIIALLVRLTSRGPVL
jgi:FlaA1/EpsC-like NDP-sugar epimerase